MGGEKDAGDPATPSGPVTQLSETETLKLKCTELELNVKALTRQLDAARLMENKEKEAKWKEEFVSIKVKNLNSQVE